MQARAQHCGSAATSRTSWRAERDPGSCSATWKDPSCSPCASTLPDAGVCSIPSGTPPSGTSLCPPSSTSLCTLPSLLPLTSSPPTSSHCAPPPDAPPRNLHRGWRNNPRDRPVLSQSRATRPAARGEDEPQERQASARNSAAPKCARSTPLRTMPRPPKTNSGCQPTWSSSLVATREIIFSTALSEWRAPLRRGPEGCFVLARG
jgi:hypothetical protein